LKLGFSVLGSSNCNLSFLFSPKKKKKKQIYTFCVVKGRTRRKSPVIFRVRNKLIKSIDQYPMTAIISSPAATATTRTAIFNYDVQFGRFCNNKNNNKGCSFLSVHSFSPPKLSPKQPHRVKLVFLTKAADSSQASPSSTATASKTIITDDEFSLAKVLIFLLLLLLFCLVLICVELISFIKFVVKI